jgi:dCTP deaminase
VKFGERIFIHPRELILGTTFEYIKLPSDIMAYITGRSTWGRLGLVIATATAIHPNYAGTITLELANLGDTPIPLCPGIRIAQLEFHKVDFKAKKEWSTYQMSVEPTFSQVYNESDWDILRKIRDEKLSKNQEKI